MRQISSMISLAAAVVLAGGAHVAGQEKPLREVISAQWEHYQEGLKEYQFRKTMSHYDLLTGEQRVNHVTSKNRHRGAWRLYVRESKEVESSVEAVNGYYAFSLGKDKYTSPWRVGDIDLAGGIQLEGVSDPTQDFFHFYSPYTFGGIKDSLPTYLKRPGFSVTKTESAGTPEEGLRKVWFKVVADEISAKQTGSIPIEGVGWLLMDPKCYWRILEYDLPFYSPRFPKNRAIAKYQYDMARDNFPLLKQIDVTYYPPESTEKPEARTVIDYVFEKRVAAEIEFRLSGFGFPEPMGTPPIARPVRWHLWLLGAAAASMAFAFVFYKLKRPIPDAKPPAG